VPLQAGSLKDQCPLHPVAGATRGVVRPSLVELVTEYPAEDVRVLAGRRSQELSEEVREIRKIGV
jgi:hypothetical protein